ncbi:putative quinol monooxygenase [Cupriavidus sp. 30B13]|uniref:putative quinol monooxygenase n=1 Tax=Cupriavidus sp. 30B13 TaxID=3384241 RepID=UPI003B907C5D
METNTATPLTVIAHVHAKPGQQARLLAEQLKLVAAARQHPGCLRYELHRSDTEQGLVIFVETWTSAAQWRDHLDSSYMAAFRNAAGECIAQTSIYEMRAVA